MKTLLRVLTYHRVSELDDSPALNPRLISATPSVFERQMRWLRDRYAVISLDELLAAVREQATLPSRAVLITFDDAYLDFMDCAWPTLERLDLPATLFVPTGFPDRPERSFWCDRLYRAFIGTARTRISPDGLGSLSLESEEQKLGSLRTLQLYLNSIPFADATDLVEQVCATLEVPDDEHESVLGWDHLRRLSKRGVALGSHTRNHSILTRVSPEELRTEVRTSQNDLKREIGHALPVLCYPNGNHDDSVVSVLEEEGIQLAFTTLDGHNDLSRDPLLKLCRTNITPRTTPLLFGLRLHRWAAAVDRWRHR